MSRRQYEEARDERKDWDMEKLEKDKKMWDEITRTGRALNEDQAAREEATRHEIADRIKGKK